MKQMTKGLFIAIALLFNAFGMNAQEDMPAKWSYSVEYREDGKVDLVYHAEMEDGWHIYTQDPALAPPSGSTEFIYDEDTTASYTLVGAASEPEGHTYFEEVYEHDIKEFTGSADFKQTVEVKGTKGSITISGKFYWIVCESGGVCRSPNGATPYSFVIDLGKVKSNDVSSSNDKEGDVSGMSFWGIFLGGFAGGLLALLTPCVFPMIPMTVSFFTKQSKNRAQGIKNALIYGFSIIFIYVVLGLGVTLILGPEFLNELSTSVGFNLFFFVMLLVFAASFLGAFEIQMPNSWINKADAKADKGGLIGIFFMAFTLALVSFSCTGPVVGTLLVEAATTGVSGPIVGMLGFSIALAFPFTLFAIFPGWLNSLPQSGGWLNSVKVVLGLLEIALALKFLSNADLVMQWGIVTREIFIAVWIVVFMLIGFYLLGKLKFSHDSDLPFITVTRAFLSIIVFSFVVYLIPGMFGAPLKMIAGFPPPGFYSEGWNAGAIGQGGISASSGVVSEHASSHCPNGLMCFDDYEEGLAYAKEVGKPVLLDFTGWACVNCRKMEADVWTNPNISHYLENDYVLISLHVDERTTLPESEQYVSENGEDIETVGQKWMDMEISKYKTATQPLYVLIDHEENQLTKENTSYDPDASIYEDFLKRGLEEFKKRNPEKSDSH